MQTRPSPTFGRPVHLRGGPHRLQPGTSPHALRIPSHDEHPALRRITPPADDVVTAIFGYGAPHSSARGTSTLPNNALLSAHYGPLRHPTRPGLALASCRLIRPAITAGASRVAPDPLCLHAVATTPAGPMELIRSLLLHRLRPSPDYSWVSSCIISFVACSAFTHVTTYRLAKSPMRPSTPEAPAALLPPPPLRLLPGGAIQFPGGFISRCGPAPFHGAP